MAKKIDSSNSQVQKHPQDNGVVKVRGSFALSVSKTKAADSKTEDKILSFLMDNSDELQLDFQKSDLSLVQKTEVENITLSRYQQMINDIPVYDSFILVQQDSPETVDQIDLNYKRDFLIPKSDAKIIKPGEAQKIALASVGKASLRPTKVKPKLMYLGVHNRLILAYSTYVLTMDPFHDWSIFVDAQTGEVLLKEDIIKSLPDGSGYVFDPNPVVTANSNTLRQPTATVGTCGYAGSALATIDAQRVTRTLKDLTLSGGTYKLDGPYAKIINITAPTSAIPEEAVASNFKYSSSDEKLGAVNVYYHIDTIQRYIQSLGITNANNRKTQADPAVNGFSAYYSPVNKSLHMGISRPCHPDKSQEGEAIIHEYGHAIQDNQVPGWGTVNPVTHQNESGAMGEGFGDILACVFFANAGNQYQRSTFEDWAYVENGASGLRRVDGTKVYDHPGDWHNEVHDDGEIWAAALWNIYRTIGGDSATLADRIAARDTLLKTLIFSHSLLLANASMADGAEAVMKTHAKSDDYRGKYLMQMLNSFNDRGILRCSSAADLYIRDDAADTGGNVFNGSVFWNSPDLWITNNDIATSSSADHQNPENGQDNWFHARVTNRGTVTARAFVVTFNVKTWAGTQFIYPGDFIPFISAGAGFNLAPGASTIVKAKWPRVLVPPANTHSCWVSSVYMPTDTTPAGKHVWEYNNLAQKNLHVVNLVPGDIFVLPIQFTNYLIREMEQFRIEVLRPKQYLKLPLAIIHSNERELSSFYNSYRPELLINPIRDQVLPTNLVFKNDTVVEMTGSQTVVLSFKKGSSFRVSDMDSSALSDAGRFNPAVEAVFSKIDAKHFAIIFNEGLVTGFPVILKPSQIQTFQFKLTVPKTAKSGDVFDINIIQRDKNNTVIGGFTITVRIKKPK